MASVAVTGGFSQLLSKDYEEVMYDEFGRHAPEWSQVAKIESADGNYIKKGELAGLGRFQAKDEGDAVSFDVPQQGNDKTVYFTEYELGIQVTRPMWEDDRTGHMKAVARDLGKSAAYTLELEFWDLFNNGFVNTYNAALDGYDLFYGAHTYINYPGNTYDNEATSASLSETSFQDMLDYFETVKNDRGIPLKAIPHLLIIPPDLRWVAERLLLSELRPGTGDNDINMFKGKVRYLVSHYLTSSTAFFMLTPEHDLTHIWRRKLTFESYDDFNTGNALFKGSMRFTDDFWDPRMTYGNAGA